MKNARCGQCRQPLIGRKCSIQERKITTTSPPQIVNNHKTKPNHADNTCFQDRPQIKIPIDCQLFQGGELTCSSRCARRSRQERREDQKEDKETNLYGAAHVGASGGVFEADEERSDADFSELQPWQPLKRMEMRRGALIWRLWRSYFVFPCLVPCVRDKKWIWFGRNMELLFPWQPERYRLPESKRDRLAPIQKQHKSRIPQKRNMPQEKDDNFVS